jgi:hypothetical protein
MRSGAAWRARARQSRAKQAFGWFLASFDWKWFLTLTFRRNVSVSFVRRQYRDFLSDIQFATDVPVGWFAVEDLGAFGRLHVHGLIAGVSALEPRDWESAWFQRAGIAVIKRYDSSKGAAFYCANHTDIEGLEYDFSDNLVLFKNEQPGLRTVHMA